MPLSGNFKLEGPDILKPSSEWYAIDNRPQLIHKFVGWDQLHFQKSWNELITQEEYNRRFNISILIPLEPGKPKFDPLTFKPIGK